MSFTENSKLEENKKSLNFIEAIIEKIYGKAKTVDAFKPVFRLSPTVICISDMQRRFALILALPKNTEVFATFGSTIPIP